MSLLCEAARDGSVSRCRQLLSASSDVEEKDEDGLPLQSNFQIDFT